MEKGPVAKTSKATTAQGGGQKVGQARERGRSAEPLKGKAVKTTLPASTYAAPRASAPNRVALSVGSLATYALAKCGRLSAPT